jgi:fatty-acyl-CoA synthase
MLALELVDGATFDPESFAAFLDAQTDLGTKWRPRFVRVSEALPMSHTNKIRKAALREEAWTTTDPVWWRPGREQDYRRLTAADTAALADRFAQAGRAALAPRGA